MRNVVLHLGILGMLALPVAVYAQQPGQPSMPPVQPSCESRLAIWQENGRSFINQVLELEAQNRELRVQAAKDRDAVAKLTQERDAAMAKGKPEEKQSQVTNEK